MTSLIRWSPSSSRELLGLSGDVSHVLDTLFPAPHSPAALRSAAFAPAVDIEETRDEFVVHVDLPGVTPKHVKVSLLGDVLTIRGERQAQEEQNRQGRHRCERRYGSFERSFSLGVPVRTDQVKASSRDGVLEIRVPKADEARTREIEVQVAT